MLLYIPTRYVYTKVCTHTQKLRRKQKQQQRWALMSLVDKAAAVAHKTVATGLVLMSTAGLAYIGLGSYDIWYRSRQNKAAKEAAAAKA